MVLWDYEVGENNGQKCKNCFQELEKIHYGTEAGELGSEDKLMTDKMMMIFKEIITTVGKIQCMVLRLQISALNFKPKGFTSNKALDLLF